MAVFSRLLGRWRGAAVAVIGIALYTLLVRGALMGGLAVYAGQLGRRQEGLNSLAFVVALMALADPVVVGCVPSRRPLIRTLLGLVQFNRLRNRSL